MPAESAPIVWVTRSGTTIKTMGGNVSMPHSEPWTWSATLDNTAGTYHPFSTVALVRGAAAYYKINVSYAAETAWASCDLVAEDYEYDTDAVTISGRCRLAELDRDDQVIEVADELSTAEGETVAAILALVADHCGLTVTGAPTRVVPQYHLVGNPLQMFRDLLEPTHGFRMGTGGQVVCFALSSRSNTGSLKDDADLELLTFRRTTEIRNKATVERLVSQAGPEVLFSRSASEISSVGVQGPFDMTPSRQWWFTKKLAYRGVINAVSPRDDVDDPVGTQPLIQQGYTNADASHGIMFTYELNADAYDNGDFVENYDVEIVGYPLDVDPPPEESYSETYSLGAGDRPYPEPFSVVSIDTAAEALAAATALVEQGVRMGQMLNLQTRLRPSKIFTANDELSLEDFLSGIDLDVVLELPAFSWDESSDTGTLTYDCTFAEED
jgi:hypothetical protein